MEFVPSTRGNNQLLVLDGYMYSKNKTSAAGVITWECVERRNENSCMAKLKTLNEVEVGRLHEHQHNPDHQKIRVLKIKGEMKRRAQNTAENTRDVLSSAVAGQTEETLARCPKEETMKRYIRNARQKGNHLPPVPRADDLQFIIPREYCLTCEGDQFLQVNNFANGSRLLIYGSQTGMDYLKSCDHWYMDGTFDTLPPQFLQLYTIHGIKNRRNVIGFYALLTNKRQVTYEQMFQHVNFFTGNATPTSINIDFEMAAINACRTQFPLSLLRCCFFHLCQNVFKKVQENNLRNLYDNDAVFKTNIRMISALAFVPVYDVVRVFTLLCNHCGVQEQPILRYFESTYIGELRAGVRGNPLYSHDIWNVYDRVIAGLPRTTNHVEGWHNGFQRSVSQSHANIWTFLSCLKKENATMHFKIAQDLAGVAAAPQKRVYRQLNESIRNIVRNYGNRNVIDYLRAISYTIA